MFELRCPKCRNVQPEPSQLSRLIPCMNCEFAAAPEEFVVNTIDGKFHIDSRQRIVKTSNGDPIPDDEPVILIRARDYLALPLLYYYRQLSAKDGCTDFHMEGIESVISKFEEFRNRRAERMKQPGITRGL